MRNVQTQRADMGLIVPLSKKFKPPQVLLPVAGPGSPSRVGGEIVHGGVPFSEIPGSSRR